MAGNNIQVDVYLVIVMVHVMMVSMRKIIATLVFPPNLLALLSVV